MYLSQADFGKVPSGLTEEAVHDRLDSYLESLRRNGQICGHAVRSVSAGSAVAYAYAVRPDSTSRQFHSRYALQDLKELCAVFGREPAWHLLADEVPTSFPSLSDISALCLDSADYDGDSPLCMVGTEVRLPMYLIPIDADERERLCFWSREYNRMLGIWYASGDLETRVYKQLALPTSGLAQKGRKLAAKVEAALNTPVYYFLMRHYGRSLEQERERLCPGCGKGWLQAPDISESVCRWEFPFRCEDCRLASEVASCFDEERLAHIGEFQG